MNSFDQSALLLTILVPLAGAGLSMFLPRNRPNDAWYFAIFVSAITLLISVALFVRYDFGAGGYQFQRIYEWLDAPLNIDLHLAMDGIAATLVLLNGIVLFGAVLISQTIKHRSRDFFVLLLALGSGVFGVFVVQDLFFLFFFYELAVLPMYLLIGVWGSSTIFDPDRQRLWGIPIPFDLGSYNRPKEYGAMKLMLVLVAGSVLIWIGILAMYVAAAQEGSPTFSMVELGVLAEQGAFSPAFQNWVFPLFMIGFGVLAGLWPFHTWSPDGHVAAPTGVSMLHAGVLMKLGAFGIIRVGMVLLPEGAEAWMPVLIVLGTVNVVYGAISAMSQRDLKYIIGYSSVSHMGYVIMGIATLHPVGLAGAVLQMFSHGIMTALMFAMVGAIYERTHIRDITVLNGLMKRMGYTSFFFAIAGLASLGLPGLSGFVAEFMVFVGVFKTYLPLAVLAVFGAALTAIYILRLLARTFFGEPDPRWEGLNDASPVEKSVGAAFVLILLFVGVWPAPLTRVINVGVDSVMKLF
ncbi:MAG: NADH-quinone oxidoreductase subunit M [Chloroflexota bacterium]|nr:NADH-quinone oxidoreductase subunit M [Chloroflexota bacterium]